MISQPQADTGGARGDRVVNKHRASGNQDNYALDGVQNELGSAAHNDEQNDEGGLKIYTTIDPELQKLATRRWTRSWPRSRPAAGTSIPAKRAEPRRRPEQGHGLPPGGARHHRQPRGARSARWSAGGSTSARRLQPRDTGRAARWVRRSSPSSTRRRGSGAAARREHRRRPDPARRTARRAHLESGNSDGTFGPGSSRRKTGSSARATP